MHTKSVEPWAHDHTFGQDRRRTGERRTIVVIVITAVTMAVEIAAGIAFGSMALLADGLHMGSHASALAVSAFAYWYTRHHARDPRFNFGTGKVNSLAAFAGATMLALFALVMAWESVERFLNPVAIAFNQAILVAVLGVIVNGVSLVILGGHGHSHGESRGEHGDDHGRHEDHGHPHAHPHETHADHNLWSAYLHVLADALTSLLAIFALLAGKYLGQNWLDPFMGLVGAALVTRWSWGLLRASAHVLLDMQAPETLRRSILAAIESRDDNRVADLHVWSIGPGIYAAAVSVVAAEPLETHEYREMLPDRLGVVHLTVETHRCAQSRRTHIHS